MNHRLPSSRGKPFRSKLLPLVDIILDLRRRRRSYADIRGLLDTEHGITVSRSTINSFVKTQLKLRRRDAIEPLAVGGGARPFTVAGRSAGTNGRASFDAIEALKRKPLTEAPKPLFVFDETKPLTLIPKTSS